MLTLFTQELKSRLGIDYVRYPKRINQARLIAEAATYFRVSPETIQDHYKAYLALHQQKGYADTFGERKTLNFEETFLLYLAAYYIRPTSVVEIGSQHGKSARRILDALDALDLNASLTCIDIHDALQFVDHADVNLILQDVTDNVRETVLEQFAPSLIFLDARPYALLHNVITEFLAWSSEKPAILAIHDCGLHLYNPHMQISKEQPEAVSSRTGIWERHVLAEIFNTTQLKLNDVRTATYHLHIFPTTHGLALIGPNAWLDTHSSTGGVGKHV